MPPFWKINALIKARSRDILFSGRLGRNLQLLPFFEPSLPAKDKEQQCSKWRLCSGSCPDPLQLPGGKWLTPNRNSVWLENTGVKIQNPSLANLFLWDDFLVNSDSRNLIEAWKSWGWRGQWWKLDFKIWMTGVKPHWSPGNKKKYKISGSCKHPELFLRGLGIPTR